MLPALLIGGGIFYMGARLYRYCRKRQALNKTLSPEQSQALYPLATERSIKTDILISTGVVIAGGALWWAEASGFTPLALSNSLVNVLRDSTVGPVLYISIFAVRPVLPFPASLMSVIGGMLFGPVAGILYTIIGSNLCALFAYGIGYQLRQIRQRKSNTRQPSDETPNSNQQNSKQPVVPGGRMLEPYIERIQARPFITVLTMRCLFLHFDVVSYGAGLLATGWRPFLLATALGSLPGTVIFVLAGASVHDSAITGVPSLDPTLLAASGVILLGTLGLSYYFNRQQEKPVALLAHEEVKMINQSP